MKGRVLTIMYMHICTDYIYISIWDSIITPGLSYCVYIYIHICTSYIYVCCLPSVFSADFPAPVTVTYDLQSVKNHLQQLTNDWIVIPDY